MLCGNWHLLHNFIRVLACSKRIISVLVCVTIIPRQHRLLVHCCLFGPKIKQTKYHKKPQSQVK